MKSINNIGAEGDVFFERVESIPADAEEVKAKGDHVVAHSETGHHHTVKRGAAQMFGHKVEPHVCYLRLTTEHADVVHHREFDTHETLRLLGGAGTVWKVTRQREWTPEGWRQAMD